MGAGTQQTELNVKRGDLVGLFALYGYLITYNGTECWTQRAFYMPRVSNIEPSTEMQFSVLPSGSKPCRNYSLSLIIKSGLCHLLQSIFTTGSKRF